MNENEEYIFWTALGGIYLLIACLSMWGCVMLPDFRHPRAAVEIDFTKPVPEIPEQAW